jgi:DNA (cytosine-5)-methyltransferase 1
MADEDALRTVAAGVNHLTLTVPDGAFIQKHHGGLDYARPQHMTKTVSEPMPGVVARPNISLVIPFRRGAKPHRTDTRPLSTVATRKGHGLLAAQVDVDDCWFRMLKPREHLRAQRFYDDYIVLGNQGEQTMQAGNSVSSNVAQWLGGYARAVIEGVAS